MSVIIEKKRVENYTHMEDLMLVGKIHNGDEDALDFLIKKYRCVVQSNALKYFLTGGDKEDVLQEGMIGLYKAIRDYKNCKKSSFRSFAELCITRQIITAVKAAICQKHSPLNNYVSLYTPIYQGESEQALIDLIPELRQNDPVTILIKSEEICDIELILTEVLSELESSVVDLYLEGKTYIEISKELNVQKKTIDNALQRVKRKVERYFESRKLEE
ncbi:RNA polymerase sporulation sigma factor SigH [Peribacillus simplex]|uniref:RNA polymerase sigma factor SigS n=3 Tax=Peribacillus simplex TaxID=1478 RepID=A0A223EBI5_9BACI|nr:RNA polymerase sporulation sigma factor SigH [Peribacillus simplex]ASS92563.1 RNA polymerase factor sigma-70 [Peribacillus simplex NBRC 15720 = DSM 1321]MEC1398435.1 RNA polymerase sporulation sigma factor SigH [Peribacillus simplex]MED3911575.1 RNA polymerase sporulation sigma factor SigH [Peribacillus simplex]MED3987687.1 RNA polymerase sporulation sigma factor SigH [Peribacillus simplex]MED4094670.1 RNA polymerase sporulation sigma factor SigH [Peribacillus simplex]